MPLLLNHFFSKMDEDHGVPWHDCVGIGVDSTSHQSI